MGAAGAVAGLGAAQVAAVQAGLMGRVVLAFWKAPEELVALVTKIWDEAPGGRGQEVEGRRVG